MGMTLLGRDAETDALLEDVAGQLNDGSWYSTQSLAFALGAVAQNTGAKPFTGFSFDYATGNLRPVYYYPSQLEGHTERKYHPGG